MTLIISHGDSLYADRKMVNGVGTTIMLSASNETKIHKLPQAYYAICGDSAVTTKHESRLDSILPINLSFMVALDWIYNNLEQATRLSKDELDIHLTREMVGYFNTLLAHDMACFLKTYNQSVILKTRYSTIVITDKYCDNFPNEIPYAYGSSGSIALEMISAGLPIKDIYRWSHMTSRLTSKTYDEANPSLEKALQPDIYNGAFYETVLKSFKRIMNDDFEGGGFLGKSMDDKFKDQYILELINLSRLVLSTGKADWNREAGTLVNIPHGKRALNKRDFSKLVQSKLRKENEIEATYSFVLRKEAEAEAKAAKESKEKGEVK